MRQESLKPTGDGATENIMLLMDDVAPGTLVKLSNPSNNKIVYAKVLGKMKGVQYSDGFDVRISEAAAKKLQTENTDKFNLAVTY
ncbi:hypothetical protein [Niabella ginsengisoli]|uniref:Uncharacterized protein n=1 Tax=Niabella ginsengisoli TaxID=522298 RepID=A0ABS9SIX3_9BACT|nr:hypothetical protein [Niabella ginsengisoli]MCH5598327.1 hypothetical protein [Niabella ginsengisoli]